MGKHTPGPWESAYRYDPITGAECAVWGADGDMVAMVFADLMNDPDGTATARLIAAAPELLSALNMAYIALAGHDEPEAERVVRAAIAKAEGRE